MTEEFNLAEENLKSAEEVFSQYEGNTISEHVAKVREWNLLKASNN